MSENIKNEVLNYLKNHLYGNLASINSNDPNSRMQQPLPMLMTDWTCIYNICQNSEICQSGKQPKVAMTIDTDEPDWMKHRASN